MHQWTKYMINSQKLTFPYPTLGTYRTRLYWQSECEWRKQLCFFQAKENWIKKKSYTKFHGCTCGLFVKASESWKKKTTLFCMGKKCHTKWVLPFSSNFMKNAGSYCSFLHIAEKIFLYQTWKLQITASIFYIFNWILKTVVLYIMRTVILFIELEWSSQAGKRRKLRWLITRQFNTVSEFWKV